jgi:hypothetical protein
VPLLVEARDLITAFQAMIRRKSATELQPWVDQARSSIIRM